MVILKHRLRLMQHDGESFVEIVVHRPEPKDRSWTCDYAIAWPEGVWRSRGTGHDALQALVLTLQKIGTEIYMSPYHAAGQLSVEGAEGGYGFPVPQSLRDLLVGADAKSF